MAKPSIVTTSLQKIYVENSENRSDKESALKNTLGVAIGGKLRGVIL